MISVRYRFGCWLKSPWRKKFGFSGLFSEMYYSLFHARASIENISICIACVDRWEVFEQHFLSSFIQILPSQNMELCIAVVEKEETIAKEILVRNNIRNYQVIALKTGFARSVFVNATLNMAENRAVFICDADIALPPNFMSQYKKYVSNKTAWFPICALQTEDKLFNRFYEEGTGLVGFMQPSCNPAFLLDESITTWGNEDWLLLYQLYENGIYPIRSFEKKMLHRYHPPVNKKNYEKKW